MRTILGAWLICAAAAWVQAPAANWKTYRSEDFGFEFRYPPAFALGAYKHTPPPEHDERMRKLGFDPEDFAAFKYAAVLIEQRLTKRFPMTALPVGEITSLSLDPRRGHNVSFDRRQFDKPEWRVELGGYEVVRLPGFPGPYGDAAYCYIVFVRPDLTVWVVAHRKYIESPHTPTNYDRIIEQIIPTLRSTR